ncbi:MAG: efflux RND transporter permease subunit [Chlamydiota bacterium]|nr:efflux RND transporter permease subunit [Chlamydiota bacterium]
MNLSAPFIRLPVMTTLVMLTVVVLGFMSYKSLPVSDMPDVDYPTITVSVSYPGASAELMANNVALPLEQQFMQIEGLTNITSQNSIGSTSIVLQFSVNRSISDASTDVQAAISRAQSKLPSNLPNQPTYMVVNPADVPILFITFSSETMLRKDLYDFANTWVGQRISMIEGVSQVLVYGAPYAVRVQMDPNILKATNLSLTDVASALVDGSPVLPLGQFDGKTEAPLIYINGQIPNAAAYNDLVVAYRDGAPVRIRDVGNAVDGLSNDRMSATLSTKDLEENTVILAIQKQSGSNTVAVAENTIKLVESLRDDIPGAVDMEILYDKSIFIKEEVWDVEFTLILAFVLVVMVIFLYLGKLADTIIPSIVLPLSIVGTFVLMRYAGYSIDELSLLALTLAIGFIVDDAIVVLENIVRLVEGGVSPWKAAMKGSEMISFTILSMSMSLIAVFIPLVFMAGILGLVFREFAMTLIFVVLVSGVVSLTLTPMLCSRFIPPRDEHEEGEKVPIAEKLNQLLLKWYKPKLKWMLKHKTVPIAAAVLSILGTYFFMTHLPIDFIPNEDVGFFTIYTQSEEGTSSEEMKRLQTKIKDILVNHQGVKNVVSVGAYPEYRQGVLFVNLYPIEDRPPVDQLIQELYPKVNSVPGIQSFIKGVPMINLSVGTVSRGDYQFAIQGLDTKAMYSSAEKLINKLQIDPMFQSVSSDMEQSTPQVEMEILRDKASSLGVTAKDIEKVFDYGFSGNYVNRLLTDINQYDIILELLDEYQDNQKTLNELYVRSNTSNDLIPLSALVKWKNDLGAQMINHISQFPSVTLSFNLAPGISLSEGMSRLKEYTDELLPRGVSGKNIGATLTFEESIKSSAILLIFAIFVVYIILGILYESFIHPITVMSTLPPAMFGGLLTLWIFNMPLSLYSYLGLIMLLGIVQKNGIMIVDFALHNIRDKGESPKDAIFDACLARFRPIMMTTVAAIFGAVPIAVGIGAGGASRRPLGMVIIGGLMFSQLLTLFLTPVIYLLMEKINAKIGFKDANGNEAKEIKE